MKSLQWRKPIIIFLTILPGLFSFVGCCNFQYKHKPVRPFPAQKPDNAAVTMNFNEKGRFYITGSKEEPLTHKPVPFVELAKYVDPKDPDGLTDLGCYTLYRAKKDGRIWLCKNNSRCFESTAGEKKNSAVFSVNFDGRDLFIGDADGKEVPDEQLIEISELAKNVEQVSKPMFLKWLSKYSIESLGAYNFYKMKGSIKIASCSANNICSCTCVLNEEPWPWPTIECRNGKCPK